MGGPLLARNIPAENEVGTEALKANGLVEDHWDEPDLPNYQVDAGLDGLQGAWFSSAGRRDAEFLIAGNHFTFRFADGDIYMGTLEISDGTPRTMTMIIAEGPNKHRGKTAVCLYEQNGELLRWCASEPGREERLADFPSEDDPKYLVLLFRREERV
jgi:hypothetical protein